MKHLKPYYLFVALATLSLLASCRKDKDKPSTSTPTATRKALYVLNQGDFGVNNSTLTYYNYSSKLLVSDQFNTVNGRTLGDTGNDIEIYGSKMYIVMNGSNTVEVANATTGKSIQQISFAGREPRYVVFNKGMAFVSCYDNTVAVIDTASLSIQKNIAVGRSPEHMAVSNGKLYVANSGGLDYPNYDKTVSVIDLTSLTLTKTITVVVNPNSVVADANGNVFVQSIGDYTAANPNSLTVINSANDQITSSTAFDGGSLVIQGSNLYCLTSAGAVKVLDSKTQTVLKSNFITDGSTFKTPYGLSVDNNTGEVFVTDAKDYVSNGSITAYGKDGKAEYTLATGIDPGAIAFLY